MKINDKITYDAITKKASIMRDGDYLYLAGELGLTDRDLYEPIRVYRPESEVLKAYDRFKELTRLPVTCEHPQSFLDLGIEDSYSMGEGNNPELFKNNQTRYLNCDIVLKGSVLDEYNKGTRELSCGWEGEFEPVENKLLGYEYIQRFKDINHIALVNAGRCGKECKVADKKMVKDNLPNNKQEAIDYIKAILRNKPHGNLGLDNLMYLGEQMQKDVEYLVKKFNISQNEVKDSIKDFEPHHPVKEVEYKKYYITVYSKISYSLDKTIYYFDISTKPDKYGASKSFVSTSESKKYNSIDEALSDAKQKIDTLPKRTSLRDSIKDNKEEKMIKDEAVLANPATEEGVNEPKEKHLELTIENAIELLIFAGIDEETAKTKAGEYFQQAEAKEPVQKLDEDVSEAKEDLKEKEEKKETKDSLVTDAIINDAIEKGKAIGRAEAVKRFSTVIPVIKSGDFKLGDLQDKTACEIKSMYIKKVMNEDIAVTDSALDKVFEIAIKSKKLDEINVTNSVSDLVSEIEKINRGK